MNGSRHSKLSIVTLRVVVCLLLWGVVVWQLWKLATPRLIGPSAARTASLSAHPSAPSPAQHKPRVVQSAAGSPELTPSKPQSQFQGAWHSFQSEQAAHAISMPPTQPPPQAIAPPAPKRKMLEPLGYAEKADGRVEAIISVGDRMQVVHEGDILEDNFKVASVSSSAVELVESSAPAAEPLSSSEVKQGTAQGPAGNAPQALAPPAPQAPSTLSAGRQPVPDSGKGVSQPSGGRELGYVERADGRVEAFVADGEQVRLTQATKSFARNFHAPAPVPANPEVAIASPPPVNPEDSHADESQSLQADSSTQEPGAPPLVASGPESSTSGEPQGTRGNNEESGQVGIMQPEPLADYSGDRLEPPELAASPTPPSAALKGGTNLPLPSGPERAQSSVSPLGYIEKAGGEREAIIEVLGQIYVVREGELFAQRYRALHITPSGVEIEEESKKGYTAPANSEGDSGADRPRIPK